MDMVRYASLDPEASKLVIDNIEYEIVEGIVEVPTRFKKNVDQLGHRFSYRGPVELPPDHIVEDQTGGNHPEE